MTAHVGQGAVSVRRALTDPGLLGSVLGGDTWRAWRTLLIAAMGESLRDDERALFGKLTGRQREPSQRVEELIGVIGRRGGEGLGIDMALKFTKARPGRALFSLSSDADRSWRAADEIVGCSAGRQAVSRFVGIHAHDGSTAEEGSSLCPTPEQYDIGWRNAAFPFCRCGAEHNGHVVRGDLSVVSIVEINIRLTRPVAYQLDAPR